MGGDATITVCHVISGDLWAGAEVQAYTLLKALAGTGRFGLTAIVLNEGKLAAKLRDISLRVIVVDEQEHSFNQLHSVMRRSLGNDVFDIIHSHRTKENLLAALLKREGRARALVRTLHGLGEARGGIKGLKTRFYAWLERYLDRNAFDAIVTVSDEIQNRLGAEDDARYVTIHNALELSTVRVSKRVEALKEELEIPSDALVIGSAGRMVPVKNYDLLIDAMVHLRKRRDDFVCVIAGDGPLLQHLKKKARALGLSQHVRFPGFRDDVHDLLSAMDIFAISSEHEGIPMVALEAYAVGTPIVSTAVGGMPEVIDDGVTGLLVDPGDAGALAEAMERLGSDSALRESMKQAGRQRLIEKFSTERLRDKVVSLYERLLAESPV